MTHAGAGLRSDLPLRAAEKRPSAAVLTMASAIRRPRTPVTIRRRRGSLTTGTKRRRRDRTRSGVLPACVRRQVARSAARSGGCPRRASRVAPRTWPPSLAATSVGEAAIPIGASPIPAGAAWSDRADFERRDQRSGLKRPRSGSDRRRRRFVPGGQSRLVIQLIVHWRGDRPSRRRHREHRPRRGRFSTSRNGGPSRPGRSGVAPGQAP